jgi:hypothetical protein
LETCTVVYKKEWFRNDWRRNYRIDNIEWTLEEYETFTEMSIDAFAFTADSNEINSGN